MSISPELLREYEAARQDRVWFDRSDRTKIEVTGGDRAAFLHNFCTNDIKGLPIGRGCEAFLCNARGKILAYFRVFAQPDALWLDAAPGLGPKIVQHLERFIITEDVAIADRTNDFFCVLAAGPTSAEGIGAMNNPRFPRGGPLHDLECCIVALAGQAYDLRRADIFDMPCYHSLGPIGLKPLLLAAVEYQIASHDCYELLRVEAGVPEYGQEIDESNYPQEVGREAKTISFTKGCYLGQEPIVMIRDRGQVSRRLVGLSLAGPTPALHGAKVWSEGKDVGHVTSSLFSPRLSTAIALGYVRRGCHEPGAALTVEMPDGARCVAAVTKLPLV